MNLREFKQKFEAGGFKSSDVETQIKAGWRYWQCLDDHLYIWTGILGRKVLQIYDSNKINPDTMDVVFGSRRHPVLGIMYEIIELHDTENGKKVFEIVPSRKTVHGINEQGKFSFLYKGTVWEDIVKWFMA